MAKAPQVSDVGSGRGDFFAVDRRAWDHVSKLDINAMVAYLVLARGTGPDQRTTAWSANAIEQYTGITWSRGKAAIAALAQAGAVKITRAARSRVTESELRSDALPRRQGTEHLENQPSRSIPAAPSFSRMIARQRGAVGLPTVASIVDL